MFGKKPSSNELMITTKSAELQRNQDQLLESQATKVVSTVSLSGLAEQINKSPDIKMVSYTDTKLETPEYHRAKAVIIENIFEHPTFRTIDTLKPEERKTVVSKIVDEMLESINMPLTIAQLDKLKVNLLDEVLGFGPLEVLLADSDVADIMVNGPKQVFIERAGKIYLTDITFASERHLLNVVQKIVAKVGRRVDENSPMVDARMPDGSRFNAIIPPLALDGSLVSIRKFKKNKMSLAQYVEYGSMSSEMAHFLEICGAIRLNILISGGTGSGKTTMLNALSGHIDAGERVITIEDAAELQLHQPHVLRLETRPANTEGSGAITQRALVKNALRMRPDRIILGEIRGDEVLDVLAAMNTGHDGSMATIHANNPRDALSRIENLVGLAGLTLSSQALRTQIASAVNLIVQVSRQRDGGRRVTHIEEIVGMQNDIITTQTLFSYEAGPMDANGRLTGRFVCSGIRPAFITRASYFGRDQEISDIIALAAKQKTSQ